MTHALINEIAQAIIFSIYPLSIIYGLTLFFIFRLIAKVIKSMTVMTKVDYEIYMAKLEMRKIFKTMIEDDYYE